MSYIGEQQRILVQVAWLYYKEGLTQREIGEKLGLSRVTVNRLLQRARERGIVQVHIDAPDARYLELESALRQAFGLRDAVVTPPLAPEDREARYVALARAGAEWLLSHLRDGMRVGLGMGRTVAHLPQFFAPTRTIACAFAEVVGGAATRTDGFSTYNVTSRMAELAGGRAEYIYAPLLASTRALRDSLMVEPTVAEALARARASDILIQSVGPVDESALLFIHGHLDLAELHELQVRGAVGDMLGQYFDAEGHLVPNEVSARVVGLSLKDVAQIPLSVVLAGGQEKVPVLMAVLRGRLCNVLITDAWTAQRILEEG